MSFCSFSKDFTERSFTSVENQFITKYLPEAGGDAVRAYLYGLYLCNCAAEFDAENTAKLLRIPLKRLIDIFGFWEECGLVQVLSRDPLFIEYLPVSAVGGKPKPVRPEKYAEFNRELFKILQKAGKDFKPYEYQRILEFLENNPMEHQAFLLVVDYCAKKDGARLSASHILNKAEKLVRERKFTYEQAEADLADFHVHEKELSRIFTLLGIYRKPQDSDYDFLEKWKNAGMEPGAVYACAETLKKGSLASLDLLVSELLENEAKTETQAREYLSSREARTSLVFKIARRLGVKIQNPRPYAEEYAEKWLERGYEPESLLSIASLCLHLSYGFPEMDSLLDEMYREGIVDEAGVKAYCASRDRQFKLIQSIQSICGYIKKTQAALDMVAAWRSWSFSDEMILEAAKRSANAAAPLPYMNKLLSEWKRLGAFTVSEIPEKESGGAFAPKPALRSEAAVAADERSDRERFYAARRQQAMKRVDRARAIAERDKEFGEAEAVLKKGEIELAKAEIFSPDLLPEIQQRMDAAKAARDRALKRLQLSERDFTPKYFCEKCSDTGYLPDGRACDCYKKS